MAAEKKIAPARYAEELEGTSLLDQIIEDFNPSDDAGRNHARDLIRNAVDQLLDPSLVTKKSALKAFNERIAEIDRLLSAQVSAIMHHEKFQTLEGSWRGLQDLVSKSETGESMKIKVLSVSKKEMLRDFQAATEFTESALWRKVYRDEYGMWGGDPFGTLVGDYQFGKGAQDVELLGHIAEVAAAAHAPFISAPAPSMFGMKSFSQMPDPRDLAKIFDKSNPENTKWLSFRDSEDSRFIGLTLPRYMARQPYGAENPADTFNFQEDVTGEDHDKYLWSNAAYAFAGRLTAAFADHHWCVAIRGPEGGGKVEGLPVHVFKSREGDVSAKCPTEVLIPEDREKELSDLGFIGLVNCKNTDYAAFFGGNAVQRPRKYDKPEATANADLSRKIPYLMATSRIAHYLKAICRDKIGSFVSRDECETFLNNWIHNYVLDMDNAPQSDKAKFPLREARIVVQDDKARPGCYKAVAHLRPHFQLEELDVALSLVAELPEAAG